VTIFPPVLKLNDDIFLYTKKNSNLGSLDLISDDILDRRDGTILSFFELLLQVNETYKMAVSSRKACKSRATSANSESRSPLLTFLVSCTAAFLDLLRSSAAKLAH